jgi:putative aldouronate transport system substrate-binding protein
MNENEQEEIRMILKKRLTGVLALLICLSVIMTACGTAGTGTGETASTDAGKAAETAADSSVTSDSEAAAESGLVSETPITLRVMYSAHSWTKDCNTLPMFQELEKKTNVHVEWDQVRSGWDEKKSTVLASGDLPDVFLSGLSDNDIVSNIDYFVVLNEYIDKYCPNIVKMFSEVPDTKRISVFPDGNLYSLPQVRMYRPESFNVMMINQQWLDNLGLQQPTTLDELEQVLIAFRDKDPNGNGKKDEIPMDYCKGRGLFSIDTLTGSYGIVDDFSNDMVCVKDGKVFFQFAREEFKKLYIYLNKLYKENLINKEVFTQDYSQMMARSQDPEIAKVGFTLGWSIVDRMGPAWAPQYKALAPLKSEGVDKPLYPAHAARVKMGTNVFEMTKSNKYPVETMKWINEFYGEDMSVQGYYGSIGECVTKNPDGTYVQLPPKEEGYSQDRWMWTNTLVDGSPMYASAELEKKVTIVPELMQRVELDKVFQPYFPAAEDIYPIVKFDKAVVDELTLIKTDIFKLVDQKMAEWVVKGNVETEWDNYMKQLEKMGLKRMEEVYQKAYDDYYGK